MGSGRWFLMVLLAVWAVPALPSSCPRGDLDARFCDRDGDLVADVPADDFLKPRALVFAYTPVEDPAVYRDVWSEFLEHMSDVTGMRVVFFPVQSNAAQIEAMRSGRLHVAGFNTGSTPLAVNCAGFVPFTMMAAGDGSYGYEMELITWPGSGIEEVKDLKGHTIAFSSPTSNSGFKAPTAILEAEFGLVAERDYDFTFSGKHDNTLLGVVNKDYDAGAMANSVRARMLARGVIDEGSVHVLYRSQTFPTTAFGHVYNLAPDIAEKVREAFASFEWEGTGLLEEFRKSGEEQFIPIEYRTHWEVIRQIDRANGVSYSCR
ncbi:MAG: phosphate/phosphite/phosphonate ABC transporter substrate-binding protein [Pseudomonadales bacterium]|nr:phosphate/phosphite/phosphonate ABC transporter substrate-binding protein [Pseudomonadales bacterium]